MKTPGYLIRLLTTGGLIMAMLLIPAGSKSAARVYPRTPSGVVEVKVLPRSRILLTQADGSYFDQSNQLFGRLFTYIKEHSIPMTAPVEGSIDKEARMAFYVAPELGSEEYTDEGNVRVLLLPERTVLALGARGSYKERNVRKHLEKLEEYLAGQSRYEAVGPAYSVFWNPPFIPWFLRHFEIHIPVREVGK